MKLHPLTLPESVIINRFFSQTVHYILVYECRCGEVDTSVTYEHERYIKLRTMAEGPSELSVSLPSRWHLLPFFWVRKRKR